MLHSQLRLTGRFVAVLVAAGLALTMPAAAQEALRGVALVIGQSDYDESFGLRTLRNPQNDARDLDDLFTDLGFDVERVLNAGADKLREELDEFAEDAAGADVAIVYYSGHGIEAAGQSYMIPVDADISSAESAGASLVSLQGLLADLQRTVKLTILLFDACRTNSMPPGQRVVLPGTDAAVAVSPEGVVADTALRGTALVATEAPEQTYGALLGFAASPDRPAEDGKGENSPYAAALIKHWGAGGYGLLDIMTLVTQEVYVETSARQLPWTYSALLQAVSLPAAEDIADADEARIREGRRELLISIADAPERTRSLVEAIALNEGVPLDSLYGMLRSLGVETSSGDLEERLAEGAERLKQLMAERPADVINDDALRRLAALAEKAEQEGAIDIALEFRRRASERAQELEAAVDVDEGRVRRNRLEIASTYVKHAQTAWLAYDFLTTAEMYRRAHEQVAAWDRDLAFEYRNWEATAYGAQGNAKGDVEYTRRSLAIREELLRLTDPGSPQEVDAILSLAADKAAIGGSEEDVHLLKAAIVDIRHAIEIIQTPQRSPERWASAHGAMGDLFLALAQLDPPGATYEDAVAAYRQALEVTDRASDVWRWIYAQLDLAMVYSSLGVRDDDAQDYRTAVAIFDELLTVVAREDASLLWADLHSGRAYALRELGELTGELEALRMSVAGFQAALEVRRADVFPYTWASTQNGLGLALSAIDWLGNNNETLQAAIEAHRAALAVLSPADDDWALTQGYLAEALSRLGMRTNDGASLRAAANANEEVLSALSEEDDWVAPAQRQAMIGVALLSVGSTAEGVQQMEAALMRFSSRAAALQHARGTVDWARAEAVRSLLLAVLGAQRNDAERVREAQAIAGEAAEVFERQGLTEQAQSAREVERLAAQALADNE